MKGAPQIHGVDLSAVGALLAEPARAAILLNSKSASEADKLDAITILRSRGDHEALALLTNLPSDS